MRSRSQSQGGSGTLFNVRINPSDFAFLYEECKCCYYRKVRCSFPRPFGVMAKIFTSIDGGMKHCFHGKELPPEWDLPPCTIRYSDKWVESAPIRVLGHQFTCTIRGKFDTVAQFSDGSYAVLDYKTSHVKDPHIALYARQLHAYAFALERPAPGQFRLEPISALGLIVFEPSKFVLLDERIALLSGGISWVEIPRDDEAFLGFLDGVLTVLEQPTPPPPSPECAWCRYLEGGPRIG